MTENYWHRPHRASLLAPGRLLASLKPEYKAGFLGTSLATCISKLLALVSLILSFIGSNQLIGFAD